MHALASISVNKIERREVERGDGTNCSRVITKAMEHLRKVPHIGADCKKKVVIISELLYCWLHCKKICKTFEGEELGFRNMIPIVRSTVLRNVRSNTQRRISQKNGKI